MCIHRYTHTHTYSPQTEAIILLKPRCTFNKHKEFLTYIDIPAVES